MGVKFSQSLALMQAHRPSRTARDQATRRAGHPATAPGSVLDATAQAANRFDLGPSWFSPGYQRRLYRLVDELGLARNLPPFIVTTEAVNCHHNYVAREHLLGAEVWRTRKGAIRAGEGELGIVPDSMGARSYIVRGKGNLESFYSSAHRHRVNLGCRKIPIEKTTTQEPIS